MSSADAKDLGAVIVESKGDRLEPRLNDKPTNMSSSSVHKVTGVETLRYFDIINLNFVFLLDLYIEC